MSKAWAKLSKERPLSESHAELWWRSLEMEELPPFINGCGYSTDGDTPHEDSPTIQKRARFDEIQRPDREEQDTEQAESEQDGKESRSTRQDSAATGEGSVAGDFVDAFAFEGSVDMSDPETREAIATVFADFFEKHQEFLDGFLVMLH